MSASIPPEIQHVLATVRDAYPGITGEKYMSALGVTALLWDHLLTFDDEIRLIWNRPFTLSKALFIFLRYGVALAMILVAYVTSGFSSGLDNSSIESNNLLCDSCKGWLVGVGLFAIVTMCVAGLVMIKRVYSLWDHRPRILHAMIVAFVLSYMGIGAFGALSVVQILRTISYDPIFFHSCIIGEKPHFLSGLWASQVAFDVYVFLMTILNAADRPRRVETEIVSALNRDGLVFFFILFVLRLINLVFSLVPEVSFTFLAPFFVWSMIIITLSRLSLQLENMRMSVGELAVSMELLQVPDDGLLPSVRSPGAKSTFDKGSYADSGRFSLKPRFSTFLNLSTR